MPASPADRNMKWYCTVCLQVQRHLQSQEKQAEAVCQFADSQALLDRGAALGADEGLH